MNFELIVEPASSVLPYCILGLLALVEGPLATLMGGVATSNGILLPIPVFLSVVLGNLTADMGWYMLGRLGKLEWLTRFSTRIKIDRGRIDHLRQVVQAHAPRLLFLAKMTVGFPIPTLIATGLSRVPVRRWAAMWILGELIKSAALVSVGYIFALTIQQASIGVQLVLWVITIILVCAAVIWYRRHKK